MLTEQDIQDACDAEGVDFGQGDADVYTPAVTLWAFVAPCLSASKSCVAAVARVLPRLPRALGPSPRGSSGGGWCRRCSWRWASHRVGQRPGRVEPREVKRRQKVKRMTRPRAQRRAELLKATGS